MLQTALFTVLFVLFILSAPVNVMATNNIMLVNFADATPAIAMQTVDNPVMGGKSSSSCHVVAGEYLVWEGTVRIINFLKAPGFCNLRSQGNPDLSVLENTQGIAFHIKNSASSFFHPMGINLQNRPHMSHGIPITYLAPAKEMDGNSDMRLYARWTEITASAYGQPVHDAPPLDAEGLS